MTIDRRRWEPVCMSLSFDEPVSPGIIAVLNKMLPIVANDGKTFLFNSGEIDHKRVRDVAASAGQMAVPEFFGAGEIVPLAYGAIYVASADGWVKLDESAP